jgi:hypothetical protein
MSENPFNDRQAEFDDRQSHLKAQNDLLALKMLHEPDFMKRVPVLSPRNERELESESQGDTFDSMGSNESRKVQDGRETSIEQDGHLNASRLAQESSNSGTNEAAIQALSSEVLARVRDHLDALLPDLIASTLEEVLRDWSRDKN